MTKTAFKKAIACVMVMALCFVAVFTGTVSADAVGTVTYTVTGTGYEPGAKTPYVTATVNFTNSDGHPFVAGVFDVVLPEGLKLLDASVAGEEDSNVGFNISNGRVLFASFSNTEEDDLELNPFSSIDILLTIVLPKSLSTYAAGATFSVTLANVDITNADEATYTLTNGGATAIHIHNYDAGTTVGNITTKTCQVEGCTAETKVVENVGSISTTNEIPVNAANVTFTKEGDVVLNALIPATEFTKYDDVYFSYKYKVDGDDTYKQGVATPYELPGGEYYAFPCVVENGIARVSYKVSGNFIAIKDGNTTISALFEKSILDWVNGIIAENKDDDENKYAKALYNYAKATAERIKVVYSKDFTDRFTADYYELDSDHTYDLPDSYKATTNGTADDSWNVSNITVTTGFKPTMNIKFRGSTKGSDLTAESVIIKVRNYGNLVYSKEIGGSIVVDNDNTYNLFDIPTKYLVNDIEITVSGSDKVVYYSYGKYAKGLDAKGSADAPVFKYLMDYAVCLNKAFPA